MTNSIGEIRDVDFLFVIGSNTSEAHPIIAMEMKRAIRRGATLVVADPRAVWMSTIAEKHLQLRPGTDVWLLNAMAQVIIEEGLIDETFVREQTEGFEALCELVSRYTPEEAERITGVPAEDIRWTARRYATTERASIFYTLGITEHTHGTDNVYALVNLVLLSGHLGKASAGLNPLRGQNNVQGANDAGASPVFFPGYQRVDDEAARRKFEARWECELSPEPGLNLNQMMKSLGQRIRGLYVNVGRLERAMNELDFLVLQEVFLNETARFADVIFPASVFAEKSGCFTNSERRVQLVRKALEPPGQAREDWRILLDFARACGARWTHQGPADIYAEMASLAPKFAGISHERLEHERPRGKSGIQWPCADEKSQGTVYLHADGVLRGKGLFQPVEYRPSMELPDAEFDLLLSTGRTLYHYNAATQTRRESGLAEKQPQAFIELHPRDASSRSIANGELVHVRTRRGSIQCRALLSRQVRPGCTWIPLHFAEARANLLTNDAGDAVTGTAEYKVCACAVTRVDPQPEQSVHFPGSFYAAEMSD